jgi:hypothetical protein
MTFDVSELQGRADQLKSKAIDTFCMMAMQSGGEYAGMAYGTYHDLAEKQFADVNHIYDDWLSLPAPEDFAGMTGNLETAMSKLATSGYTTDPVGGGKLAQSANTDLTGVTTSGGYMADWTGDAASTYQTNFAANFAPVSSNQFVLASVLRQAINAEAAIWQTVRDDLDKLSADALKKMDECTDKSPSDWAMALTVAAAVVSIVAVPVTGGTSLELGFAAVGAGLSVAATGISGGGGEADEYGLDTGSPGAIIDSLRKALVKINDHIVDGESMIAQNMDTQAGNDTAGWAKLCLPRPSMADAPQHPYDDPSFTGESNG